MERKKEKKENIFRFFFVMNSMVKKANSVLFETMGKKVENDAQQFCIVAEQPSVCCGTKKISSARKKICSATFSAPCGTNRGLLSNNMKTLPMNLRHVEHDLFLYSVYSINSVKVNKSNK